MVAVAGDGSVDEPCHLTARPVPSAQAIEEGEVPENTPGIAKGVVLDVEPQRHVFDADIGLNEHNLPVDDGDAGVDFVSRGEHVVHGVKGDDREGLFQAGCWYFYLHRRVKVSSEVAAERGFVQDD